MGTRALVHVKGDIDFLDKGQHVKVLVTIYRQFDGYPEGLGKELEEICNGVGIVNGFSGSEEIPKNFNGMGCFAAYLVGKLKGESIGNIYLYPPNSNDVGEEYVYTITVTKDHTLKITTKEV